MISTLSEGVHIISASVTDSGLSTETQTVTLTVAVIPNEAPTITITSPIANLSVLAGTMVSFIATASDAEDGDLTAQLSWSSSLEGVIGTGGNFSLNSLSVGTHIISASVTDSEPETTTENVTIIITANQVPTVTITLPEDGIRIDPGDNLDFIGNAQDAEDGDLSSQIIWSSSIDGSLGTGNTLSAIVLSEETHTITASVSDAQNQTGQATIQVLVELEGGTITIVPIIDLILNDSEGL